MIECTIAYNGHIYLDESKIKVHPQVSLSGAYGHEQRHVQSVLDFLKTIKSEFEPETGICVYYTEATCSKGAGDLERRMRDKIVPYLRSEDNHTNGSTGGPATSTQLYPPIGTMPNSTPAPPNAPSPN